MPPQAAIEGYGCVAVAVYTNAAPLPRDGGKEAAFMWSGRREPWWGASR